MSIERKRNLLRISREIQNNRPINHNSSASVIESQYQDNQKNAIGDNLENINHQKRILTKIKSSYLGNTLYPNYINKFRGETFIVAGCGSSVNYYTDFSRYYVIGVNDIERILTPDFLVVVNEHRTFMRGRWDYVRDSLSPVIFSHLENPGPIVRSSHLCKIQIGKRGELNLDDLTKVDYTMNSPYMAVIIAYQLGAKKIGMIGVDFTNNHFFSKTGPHRLSKSIRTINEEYSILKVNLEKKGVKVANLSPISLLDSWPKMDLEQFDSF